MDDDCGYGRYGCWVVRLGARHAHTLTLMCRTGPHPTHIPISPQPHQPPPQRQVLSPTDRSTSNTHSQGESPPHTHTHPNQNKRRSLPPPTPQVLPALTGPHPKTHTLTNTLTLSPIISPPQVSYHTVYTFSRPGSACARPAQRCVAPAPSAGAAAPSRECLVPAPPHAPATRAARARRPRTAGLACSVPPLTPPYCPHARWGWRLGFHSLGLGWGLVEVCFKFGLELVSWSDACVGWGGGTCRCVVRLVTVGALVVRAA